MLKVLCGFVISVHGIYDNTKPIVMMNDYSQDYRTLNCWECLAAEGVMCSYKDNKSMIALTGSSNEGHGLCCKPGSKNKYC